MASADELASLGVGIAIAGLAIGIMGKMVRGSTKPAKKAKSMWFN